MLGQPPVEERMSTIRTIVHSSCEGLSRKAEHASSSLSGHQSSGYVSSCSTALPSDLLIVAGLVLHSEYSGRRNHPSSPCRSKVDISPLPAVAEPPEAQAGGDALDAGHCVGLRRNCTRGGDKIERDTTLPLRNKTNSESRNKLTSRVDSTLCVPGSKCFGECVLDTNGDQLALQEPRLDNQVRQLYSTLRHTLNVIERDRTPATMVVTRGSTLVRSINDFSRSSSSPPSRL